MPFTPTFGLRPAQAEDQTTIRALVRQERLDPTSLHWRNFLVAEDAGGRIVGIGQVKPLPGARELGSLVVVPEYRQQGVGAALIQTLWAREKGPLYLLTRDRRVPYYQKFGFRPIGWRDAPWAIRAKLLPALAFRLFGVRVVAMRRETEGEGPRTKTGDEVL